MILDNFVFNIRCIVKDEVCSIKQSRIVFILKFCFIIMCGSDAHESPDLIESVNAVFRKL